MLQSGVFVAIALLSPFLIQGSQRLSDSLENVFAFGGSLLGTPWGMAGAIVCAIGALLARGKVRLDTLKGLLTNGIS